MKKRSTDILQQLLTLPGQTIPAERLTKKYAVSLRTLKNDMKEINHFLQTFCSHELHINEHNQLFLTQNADIKQITEKIFQMDTYMYKFSPEERQIYTLALLTSDKDYVSMEKIAANLSVNRLTIMNDIDEIKKYARNYNIALDSKSGKGIKLIYKEEKIRSLWINLLKPVILNVKLDGFFQKALMMKLGNIHPLADFIKTIRRFEQEHGCFFAEAVFYEIALYLFVVLNRIANGNTIKKAPPKPETNGGEILKLSAAHLSIPLHSAEQNLFNHHLAENNLHPIIKETNDIELYKILSYFLSEVGTPFGMHFQEDDLLLDSLAMHIKTLHQGTMLEVSIEENLPIKFQDLLKEVTTHRNILEKFLGFSLDQNLLYSITIHICASLLRNASSMPQASVLIVCPGSMATGKLLEAQIKNYFNFRVLGVIAASRILDTLEQQQQRIDFIISTVEVMDVSCPVITVKPLLTLENLKAIQQQALLLNEQLELTSHPNKSFLLHKIDRLTTALSDTLHELKNLSDLDPNQLNLAQSLFHYNKENNPSIILIQDLLQPEDIMKIDREMHWEEAIRLAGGILKDRCYSEAYIDKMVKNVKEYGPYIVIGKGVALAHANMESDVRDEGLSLLISRDGISFEEDLKVHLLFCFCTKGKFDYLELFKQIVTLGKNTNRLKLIIDEIKPVKQLRLLTE